MRRKKTRKIRYRPVRRDRRSSRRVRFTLIRAVLIATVTVSVSLIASAVWRTIATRRLSAELQAIHTADGEAPSVQVAAPPIDDTASESLLRAASTDLPEGVALMGSGNIASESTSSKTAAATLDTVTSTCYHNTNADFLPEMLKLSKANPDLVGWLHIDGVVNLPVVYRDNEYYLTHDFYGHRSKAGTLFLDVSHPLTENAANLVIHGHDMADGTMFGLLVHYQRSGYIEKHPEIRFSTLWEAERYLIFAVLRTPTDPKADGFVNCYAHPTFASDADFNAYVDTLRSHALRTAEVDVRPGDALLTLTTCLDDDRLVIVARKLRANEIDH